MTVRATLGWSEIGRRCDGVRDGRAPGRTNAIGALIGRRLLTVGLFQADINAEDFRPWIERDASPKLPPRSVLVMDNAAFHKRAAIQSFIRNAGHTLEYLPAYSPDLNFDALPCITYQQLLEYLPAYSPDLNPIERKRAHLKSVRKQTAAAIQNLFRVESFYMT
jgi:transposase